MKNLSKDMIAIYAVCILGIILIVFGSVKMVFFGEKDSTVKEKENNNGNGNVEVIIDNNNKLTSYIDLVASSIEQVKVKVEKGEYDFITDDAVYLLSVGEDKCVNFDAGKKSPYSDSWDYFYVGVTHNDKGYDYYAVALDSSGMGMDFRAEFELYADAEYVITDVSRLTKLGIKDIYLSDNGAMYSVNSEEGYLLLDELEGGRDFTIVSSREKVVFVSKCS